MSQNLANHFEVCPAIDLPAGMAVSKCMRPDHFRHNTGTRCIMADPISNRRARDWRIRHFLAQEHLGNAFYWRTFPPQVRGQRSGHRWHQRQFNANLGFWPACFKSPSLPVHVFQAKAEHFGSAQTISCHQQKHREIAFAGRRRLRYTLKNTLHVLPGQHSRRSGGWVKSWRHDPTCKLRIQMPCNLQKSQKSSKRTASIDHR